MQTPDIFLTAAGIILFVALIILLFRQKIQGKTAFLLFLVVVIMIGYPTIKTITIDDELVSIEKYSNQLSENPQDTEAANQLSTTLDKTRACGPLQDKPQQLALATNAFKMAAAAHVVSGQTQLAQGYLDKLKTLAPNSQDVKVIQQHLDAVKSSPSPEQRNGSRTVLQQRFLARPVTGRTAGHK